MSLVLSVASLSRAAPKEWEQFLEEYKKYQAEITKQLVQSPGENVLVAQGRAQQAASLADLFSNAVKTADRLTKK
jgi:hypothetical protein